ncbi:MAG: recombination mediator protein UvsY [Methanobacterium sp.]
MDLNEIEKLWKEDSYIDPDNLHLESIKIPSLHSKYFNIYNNLSLLKKKEENNFLELQKEKWLYYSGKADPEIYKQKPFDHRVLKSDLDKYLDADDELIRSNTKIEYYNIMLKFLESILKSIENRSFQIKNSIDFQKFIGGFS